MTENFTVTDPESAFSGETARETEDFAVDGLLVVQRNDKNICCISIIGQIEGHYLLPSSSKTTKYEHMIPRLLMAETSKEIDALLLILNTVGGDIEAGLAVSELISGMRKPTASLVLGGGHSIGIPLAVSAKRSFICESATMTVHPVRMNGVVLGAPQTYMYFNNIQERIIRFVCSNSTVTPDKFRSLMLNPDELANDTGTILSGSAAVAAGLIDQMGSVNDALDYLAGQTHANDG